jgi:hypothetical protein
MNAVAAPRKATAPGVGLAYDVAAASLAAQLALVDTLITRLAGVVAATIGVAAVSVQAAIPPAVRAITVIWLIGAVVEAVMASRATEWKSAPNPQTFARYAGDDPEYMKQLFLPDVLDVIHKNKRPLALKSWRLNWAILYVGIALSSLVVGKVIADLGLVLLWSTVDWVGGP